jgi:hypothetical protein
VAGRPLRTLCLEQLEDRAVPATFGLPWADPTRLTLSFAPDGTPVAGRASDLYAGLNQDRSPNEWQRDILRAFHTWAARTNFDIAVVPDDGSRFGTPGRLQGDPRFGDVRVGGNRLSRDALAVGSPPDPALAGTLAGDVFVNTTYRFKDTPYDLYSVMLHEAGHAFGLDHSTDPNSPMFPRFNNTKTALTAGDIRAIRTLYGPRVAVPAVSFVPPSGFTRVPVGYWSRAARASGPRVWYGPRATASTFARGTVETPSNVTAKAYRPTRNGASAAASTRT